MSNGIPFAWEVIDAQTLRAMVPGGWLVRFHSHTGAVALTMVPDPEHAWEVEIPPEIIEESATTLVSLEKDLQDPYIDDQIKAEKQAEAENLRRFIQQHS